MITFLFLVLTAYIISVIRLYKAYKKSGYFDIHACDFFTGCIFSVGTVFIGIFIFFLMIIYLP